METQPGPLLPPVPGPRKAAHSAATDAARLAAEQGVSLDLAAQPAAFLREVWGSLPAAELVGLGIESDYWSQKTQAWCETVKSGWAWSDDQGQMDELVDWMLDMNADQAQTNYHLPGRGGAFWYTASRKQTVLARSYARGGHDDLRYTGALWCDLDCATEGYPLATGLRVLLSMPLPPSVVVFSGGGLQGIHLLSEPWDLGNRAACAEFKSVSLNLYKPHFNAHALTLDTSVHDAARMMRLPGTVNRKPSRGGAVARILHWQPERRYTIAEVRQAAQGASKGQGYTLVYPGASRGSEGPSGGLFAQVEDSRGQGIDGPWPVGVDFATYLIDSQRPEPGQRHRTAISLALQAARAGIPRPVFEAQLVKATQRWPGDHPMADHELANILAWAYAPDRDLSTDSLPLFGVIWVSLDESGSGFTRAERGLEVDTFAGDDFLVDEVLDPADPNVLPLDETTLSSHDASANPAWLREETPPLPVYESLDALRADQDAEIASYIQPGSRRPPVGTYLLLKTPPGAGKTHATWQAVQRYIQARSAQPAPAYNDPQDTDLIGDETPVVLDEPDGGQVLFAGLFKEQDPARYWQDYGIDPKQVYYLVERNADPLSRGYCALHAQSEVVARKGHPIRGTLCLRCEHHDTCKLSWYLSQFREMRRYPITHVRHQQLYLDELRRRRELVVIDETPEGIVAAPMQLRAGDLVMPPANTFVQTNYADTIRALNRLITALRDIAGSAVRPVFGRELFDRIVEKLDQNRPADSTLTGRDELAHIAALTLADVRNVAGEPQLDSTSLEAVSRLHINYLVDLWRIVAYEHQTFYAQDAVRWNSRLCCVDRQLELSRMAPVRFSRRTRIIVTDATGLPEMYPLMLADNQDRPRAGHVFEARLEPRATIVQFLDSNHSRAALRHENRKVSRTAIQLPGLDGDVIEAEKVRTFKNQHIEALQKTVEYLAERHDKSLLVVTYKDEAMDLRAWDELPISPDQVEWFYNLRGKNTFKGLEAIYVAGTPFLAPQDLVYKAGLWRWRDDVPLSHARAWRLLRYPAQPYLLRYRGYADDRLDNYFVGWMQAELRQCADRIRLDTSASPRFLYLDTRLPCTPYVTTLIRKSQFFRDEIGLAWYKEQIKAGRAVFHSDYLNFLTAHQDKTVRCTWKPAKESWERVHPAIKKLQGVEEGSRRIPVNLTSKLDTALAWITVNDPQLNLSIRQAQNLMHEQGMFIGTGTVTRAYKQLRTTERKGDPNYGVALYIYS